MERDINNSFSKKEEVALFSVINRVPFLICAITKHICGGGKQEQASLVTWK